MHTKLIELVEKAYATAVTHDEVHAKADLWEILLLLKQTVPLQQEHPSLGYGNHAPVTPQHRDSYSKIHNKRDMLIIAYVLSEFGHELLFPGENHTQQNAIDKAANLLGVKRNTLQLQRDHFDSFTNSHRQGWKKELSKEQQEIFDYMVKLSKESIRELVQKILYSV